MDKERAEKAVRELLLALDQDIESEGLKDTPRRVAEMFIEQCSDSSSELDRVFTEEKIDQMVTVRDIPFISVCEHHLVHYFGRAHISYIPKSRETKTGHSARVVGISKLARLVMSASRGFTTQERVTQRIADTLYNELEPYGCIVVVEAEHGCMNLRGARAFGASTTTSAVKGVFRDVPAARSEFLGLVSKGGPR